MRDKLARIGLLTLGAVILLPGIGLAQNDPACTAESTELSLAAENNAFDTDCLAAPPDEDFSLTLENRDRFSHNVSIYTERGGDALFTGEYVVGDTTLTYDVPAIAAGSYIFICDIHPQMAGTFNVGGGGEAPAPTSSSATEEGRAPQGATVELELVARGFAAPVFMTSARDGSDRLFVVDQIGVVRIVDGQGELLQRPFLDVRNKIIELDTEYDERGLLGLAFHPNYSENGRLFAYYSAPLRPKAPEGWNHTARLSEFKISKNDPDRVDPASERVILEIDKPQSNHNGGHIAFGPDGFLYLPIGDGGMGNDVGLGHSEQGNGQDVTNLLGSVLRLDVDGDAPYAIPSDNPFVGDDNPGVDEIFAYGFRNPYHLSFDVGGDNELFVADAGQDRYEEVSIVENGGNYGWRIKEATHCFDPESPSDAPDACPAEGTNGDPLIDPVIEYSRLEILGSVVIGGYVYRGSSMPELEGAYIFGDYSRDRVAPDGTLFAATRADAGLWPIRELGVSIAGDEGAGDADGHLGRFVLSFGEDESNELYVGLIELGGPTGSTGAVYRFAGVSDTAQETPPPSEPTADGSGMPTWVWVLVALAVIGLLALLMRKQRN